MQRRNFFQTLAGGIAALVGHGYKLKAAPTPVDLQKIVAGKSFTFESTPIGDYTYDPMNHSPSQEEMLYSLLKTAGGRQKLANSLGLSLRRRRDYKSLVRKAFQVVDGTYVDSLDYVDLYCARPKAKEFLLRATGIGVQVPITEITSRAIFPVTHITERRADLIARSINLGKEEIIAAEDTMMFSLIDAVTKDDVEFEPSFLSQVRRRFFERGVEDVDCVFAHPHDTVEVIKLGDEMGFEPECNRKMLLTGMLGCLYYGSSLYQSQAVPQGYMYVTGHTEPTKAKDGVDNGIYAGYVADKTTLNVLSSDHPPDHCGFLIREETGLAVNPIAVQRVSMKKWRGTGWDV